MLVHAITSTSYSRSIRRLYPKLESHVVFPCHRIDPAEDVRLGYDRASIAHRSPPRIDRSLTFSFTLLPDGPSLWSTYNVRWNYLPRTHAAGGNSTRLQESPRLRGRTEWRKIRRPLFAFRSAGHSFLELMEAYE